MKTVTKRDFLHQSTRLTDALLPGQAILITRNGQPDFKVVKLAARPKNSWAEFAKGAVGDKEKPKVDTTALIKELR